MLGLIPKVLVEFVSTTYDEETAHEVKRRAGVASELEFRINEVYDDQLWLNLVVATCELLQCSTDKLEEDYAKYFLEDAQKRWPAWFKMSKNAQEFLGRHPAVHNNFADAVRNASSRDKIKDKFRVENLENKIITHYCSSNRHCHLYTSLAREVLNLYGERAVIEEPTCMKRGAEECEIWIT